MTETTNILKTIVMSFIVCHCLCVDPCSLAQEGRPYQLQCEVNRQHQNGKIYWLSTTKKGEQKVLFSCDFEEQKCDKKTNDPQFLTASIDDLNSRLDIANVTHEQRDTTYTCRMVSDSQESRPSYDIMTCRMRLYSAPEIPNCSAQQVDTDVIRVSCVSDKVYPGITCEILQIFNSGPYEILNVTFAYEKTLLTNGIVEYYSMSCSVDIIVGLPGSYVFVGTMAPSVDGTYFAGAKTFDFIEEVIVRSASTVTIKQSVGEECPAVNHFQCKATFFEDKPKFSWYIGEKFISNGEILYAKVSKGKNNYAYTSVSTLDLKTLHEHNGKTVKCVVSTISSTKENTTLLKMTTWPPDHPPVFKDENDASIGIVFEIQKHDNVTLVCVIKGGKPKISSTRVQCLDSNQGDNVIDKESSGDTVSFTIFGSEKFHRRQCQCSGSHSTGCYNATERISFYMVSANRTVAESRAELTTSDHIYIIVGVVVGVVVLALAFAGFMTLKKHWHGLYYSLYSYFYFAPPLPPRRDRNTGQSGNPEMLADNNRGPDVRGWLAEGQSGNPEMLADNNRGPDVRGWLAEIDFHNRNSSVSSFCNETQPPTPPSRPKPCRMVNHKTKPNFECFNGEQTVLKRMDSSHSLDGEQTALKRVNSSHSLDGEQTALKRVDSTHSLDGEQTALKKVLTAPHHGAFNLERENQSNRYTVAHSSSLGKPSLDSEGYMKMYPDPIPI